MRILLTGGAGFIGSHLADHYVAKGDQVTILDNFSTGSQENIAHLAGKVTTIDGDIRKFDLVEKLLNIKKLDKKETYEVLIDTELKKGSLTFGEILIPGKTKKEILISTNICHPSMANNELSGPCVSVYLARWIQKLKKRNTKIKVSSCYRNRFTGNRKRPTC